MSLDRVAKQVGITKPGLMYHFPTKEALMLALVDHVVDRWESQLNDALGTSVQEAGPVERIAAYAEFTLSSTFGTSDIVMLADPRLREQMTARWHQRIEPWVVIEDDPRTGLDSSARAQLNGVRLMADGAWLASATGVLDPGEEQRREVLEVARDILKSLEVDG
ncbi:TetR/AcrR family transcriptional regulator [Corynebacterium glyciniphilum]|uniref:TetR/AcrR family transcriptional regulator n=1 Tax=Corynebacterium glyciniphilum TaxID=1404244 RepID=UPI003DA0560F